MKLQRFERDERLSFWRSFFYEFNTVFLIILVNGAGLVAIFNNIALNEYKTYIKYTIIVGYLLFGCLISSALVYLIRARGQTIKMQNICEAAQKVAAGDFSVRLDVYKDKKRKNEIDILKEDFNTMVTELASIEKLKDNFVADVSHEIKTPLSVIQGYADLLQTNGISDEQRGEYIKRISEQINKLTNLVTNILKLNKIESKEIVCKEKFSLDEQMRFCILSLEDLINEKDIEIEVNLDEVEINSDPVLLELVWNNLLSNAVKFTDRGGMICVSLSNQGNVVIATVRDTGCGMSEETCKHIFDKFYQGDTSHSQEGNGLGLALVDRVVTLLDGEILVSSQPNKGSEFKIILDL
ncbi:MAG: HAMP domain-containing histidine kinase [Ruminococcaceae bacterium]|nr:HAMP domain-containing histidine kinase [Oscillospiraceae bacterium]